MRHGSVASILCLLSIAAIVLGSDTSTHVSFEEIIEASAPPYERLAITNATIVQAVDALREKGMCICFELSLAYNHRVATFDEIASSLPRLAQLVAPYFPEYSWSFADDTDIVIVAPRYGSALSWSVSAPRKGEFNLFDVLATYDFLDLRRHKVGFLHRGMADPIQINVQVDFDNIPVTECLTRIVASSSAKMCWTVRDGGNDFKILTFQTHCSPRLFSISNSPVYRDGCSVDGIFWMEYTAWKNDLRRSKNLERLARSKESAFKNVHFERIISMGAKALPDIMKFAPIDELLLEAASTIMEHRSDTVP